MVNSFVISASECIDILHRIKFNFLIDAMSFQGAVHHFLHLRSNRQFPTTVSVILSFGRTCSFQSLHSRLAIIYRKVSEELQYSLSTQLLEIFALPFLASIQHTQIENSQKHIITCHQSLCCLKSQAFPRHRTIVPHTKVCGLRDRVYIYIYHGISLFINNVQK